MGRRIEVKDKAEVTLNDILSVLSDKEKEALYFEIGSITSSVERWHEHDKLSRIVLIIKKITGVDDLWLLYYGRTLLGQIEEEG